MEIQTLIPQTAEDIELLRIATTTDRSDYGNDENQPQLPTSDIEGHCKAGALCLFIAYATSVIFFKHDPIRILNWVLIPLLLIFIIFSPFVSGAFKEDVFSNELVLPEKKKYITRIKNESKYKVYARIASVGKFGLILMFSINMTSIFLGLI